MIKNKFKKELALEDIAELIERKSDETRQALENKIDATEERLSTSTQKQFLAEREYMDKRFEGIDKRFEGIDKCFEGIEDQLNNIKADLNKKVDIFTHNDLTYRVEKLEDKAGKFETAGASA